MVQASIRRGSTLGELFLRRLEDKRITQLWLRVRVVLDD